MSPTQAKQTVLVSMAALMVLSLYRAKSQQGSLYKRMWGTGVVGVFLSLAADFAPTLAGPFAVLVVLGSLTNGGDTAVQNLLGGLAGGSASPPSSAAAGGSSSTVRTGPSSTVTTTVDAAGNKTTTRATGP